MIKHLYTPAEIAFLKENVKGCGSEKITQMFNAEFNLNLKISQVRAACHNRGFTNGIDCRFRQGHVPANKGKKGIGGWEPTQFKPGHIPVNYRPVGSERIDRDGYIIVKTADPNIWRPKHVVAWEKEHGPRPKGMVLLFLDRNKQNVDLDNLRLVSRQQMAILNKRKLLQKDKAINESAILTASLIIKIGDKKKQMHKQNH